MPKPANKLFALEVSTLLAAVVCVSVVARSAAPPDWGIALFLSALCVLAEMFATRLPVVGAVSLSSAILLAAVLLGGAPMGVVVAGMGSISVADIRDRKPPLRMLFNTGQYVVGAALAAAVFSWLGGTPLLEQTAGEVMNLQWFGAVASAAVILAATNVILVGMAIAFFTGSSLGQVWRQSLSALSVSFLALALLGMVLAELLLVAGIPGTLLIVVPFMIARQTFEVFRQQSSAYRETVRSLVTAIEAKDPYTRGHSERVARYASEIADRMGLAEAERQRVEWAALLHDIGKLAVDTRTLNKPGGLTSAEQTEVRRHPGIAEEILADIDFLEDAVSLIRAHHERLDGSGYPRGLAGAEIELGARILAVADSFDAMTSSRAYRSAMRLDAALAELNHCAGTGLDPECVRHLADSVNSDVFKHAFVGAESIAAVASE